MDQETSTKYEQLYNNAVDSIQRYNHSIRNMLNGVLKKKDKDSHLNATIHTDMARIKRSISEIQTIQQKKKDIYRDTESLKNMVSYKINQRSGIPSITVEEDTPLPPWIQNL